MKCPACGVSGWRPRLGPANKPKSGEVKWKCKHCDHTWFKIGKQQASEFHEENVVWRFGDLEKRDAIHARRLAELGKAIEWPVDSVLDCGCGDGSFLDKVDAKRKTGIDISPEAHSDYEFISGSFSDYEFRKKFELVMCYHVVEHIPNCAAAVEKLASLSSKYLAIEVPVKRKMRYFNGGHVHGFADTSFDRLLRHHAKEFETMVWATGIQGSSRLWVGRKKA